MEIEPRMPHERCPVFIGSKVLVEQAEACLAREAKAVVAK